jgi:hypothetical protein
MEAERNDEVRSDEGRAAVQRSLDWQDNSAAETDD